MTTKPLTVGQPTHSARQNPPGFSAYRSGSLIVGALLLGWQGTPAHADDLQAAVDDICACGFPPSNACMSALPDKYPRINASSALQDEVMQRARTQCGPSQRGIADLVRNQNLSLDQLPAGVATALAGIDSVVSETSDCSTADFQVDIPAGWQCRKVDTAPRDVTLYTHNNALNVSLGHNQGKTSCHVIPICQEAPAALSAQFDTTVYTNSIARTVEFAGSHRNDPAIRLTITSTTQPSDTDLRDIGAILDSVTLD